MINNLEIGRNIKSLIKEIKDPSKNQLEIKNKKTEITKKTSMDEFSCRLDMTEEIFSELEGLLVKIIQF